MPLLHSTGGITTADWPQEMLSDPVSADRPATPLLDHGMYTGVRVLGMSAVSADRLRS
jgi:hypothetical protein